MSVLVSGSIAYDNIMVFQDRFKNHILPDQIHILNVSFFVPEMRKEFGGCAGNIAYANKLLGGNPIPMATVGNDFGAYRDYLNDLGIDGRAIKAFDEHLTAQAFITTDIDDNQITAFHPGAMSISNQNEDPDLSHVVLGIISPDSKEGMIKNAKMLEASNIPMIFDPGQALPLYEKDELLMMINLSDYVIANDYEAKLIEDKTGLSVDEISEKVKGYIITLGAEGSVIHQKGMVSENIKPATITKAVDPTGCGDAFRGGLLFGLENNFDLSTSVKIGSVLGAKKIESNGPQNYSLDKKEVSRLLNQNYGLELSL